MNCKEIEKLFPFFQEDALTTKELQRFMAHIDTCEECKEELAIYYLINEGMLSLEDGNAFDLQKVMDSHMERAKARLRLRRTLQSAVYGLEGLVVAAIFVILALIAFQ